MKGKSFLFFLLIVANTLISQNTFNLRLDFNRPVPTVLTSIEVNDSCFYVCGITNDSLPPFRVGSLFAKLNFDGDIEYYTTLTDSLRTFGTWRNTLTPTDDGNFLVSGIASNPASAALFKYSPSGDTIFSKFYQSPNAPANIFISNLSLLVKDESIWLINNTSSSNSTADIHLIKTDHEGLASLELQYGGTTWNESSRVLLEKNNKLILGAGEHNTSFENNNFIFRTYLIQIDSLGNIEWEYRSPEGELQYAASDLLLAPDGGYVIATAKGIEIPVSSSNSTLRWQHYIYKLDANREFEWGVDIRDITPSDNFFNKLIHVSDESGYVAVGTIFEDTPEPGYNINGLITKISTSGDSLWTRYYNYVQSPADTHIFYDVEETPDGGFIMVGEATNNMNNGELPLQQAWVVKVDQHGCLVPGCHLIDVVEDHLEHIKLQLYPNPSSDYLNVYYYAAQHWGEIQYRIIDTQGKVHRAFSSERNDITHVIPISDLATGQYFLTMEGEWGVMRSEAFVKQ